MGRLSRSRQYAYIPVALLLLLSLLESSTVLTRDLLPDLELAPIPPLQHAAMTLGCFGLIAAAATILSRNPRPSNPAIRRAILAGLAVFAAPACLAAFATTYIHPLTAAALITLAPLFSTILDPYLGASSLSAASPFPLQDPPRYGILPSIIAFAGVLLLFPVFVPTSWQLAIAFAAALLAAFSLGAGNCLLQASVHRALAPIAAITTLLAAVTLAALSFLLERPRLHPAMLNLPTLLLFLSELLALALLFHLTRRLGAPILATRVLWSLLMPILIELAATPAPIPTRSSIGIALFALGACAFLIPARRSAHPDGLTLR